MFRSLKISSNTNDWWKTHVYKYTACKRRFETYTKRCNEIINKDKKKHKIIEKETALSNINSRTSEIDDYNKFIIKEKKLKNNVKKSTTIFYLDN